MTDSRTRPAPPYTSKEDFLAHGLDATILEEQTDCSICLQRLIVSTAIGTAQNLRVDKSLPRVSSHDDSTLTSLDELVPEHPVRIHPCRHLFGSNCILSWFNFESSPNRCPECNTVLFLPKHMHAALRRPTLASRAQFADFVEHVLQDAEGAEEIRRDLLDERTAFAMREFTLEILRQQGWDVSWEYADEEEGERDEVEGNSQDGSEFDDQEDTGTDLESGEENGHQLESQYSE